MVTFHGERVQGKYVLFQTKGKNWMIHRMDPPAGRRARADARDAHADARQARPSCPKTDDGWGYEIKWDGIRALAFIDGGRIRLVNRNGARRHRAVPRAARAGHGGRARSS